jgi:hypothetical protein
VTVHYFSRIVQLEAVFFRIVHYVREVTRWFLSSASKLFLIVIYKYNQINFNAITTILSLTFNTV